MIAQNFGGIDFRLFHTGCPVASHGAKFTIQKFGERPPAIRVAEMRDWDEDVPESTRQLFRQADVDQSGRLDATELTSLHPKIGISRDHEDENAVRIESVGEALLTEVDIDKSNDVDLLEFAANGHHWKGAAR